MVLLTCFYLFYRVTFAGELAPVVQRAAVVQPVQGDLRGAAGGSVAGEERNVYMKRRTACGVMLLTYGRRERAH